MRLFTDASARVSDPLLRRAYGLALRGRGTTSPNPMVGCVIVRDGVVVGEGFHARAGGPHAEAVALAAAGAAASGATAYVTLEPCNHFGKTPPCAPALVRAGVARVVVGMRDPDLGVAGGGIEALAHAGVAVELAEDDAPFRALNEAWLKRLATGLPWVRVKLALTLDARLSLAPGVRTAISGPAAAAVTHELRAGSRAVAVGVGTLRVDDPSLTVRSASGEPAAAQPLRAIVSRTSLPRADARMLHDGAGPVVIVTSERADAAVLRTLSSPTTRVVTYPYAEGIVGALRTLSSLGVDDVLVEAGPGLASALWKADAIDELFIVQAGGMGGNAAPPLYLGPADAADGALAPRMRAVAAELVGDDVVSVWRREGEDLRYGRSA